MARFKVDAVHSKYRGKRHSREKSASSSSSSDSRSPSPSSASSHSSSGSDSDSYSDDSIKSDVRHTKKRRRYHDVGKRERKHRRRSRESKEDRSPRSKPRKSRTSRPLKRVSISTKSRPQDLVKQYGDLSVKDFFAQVGKIPGFSPETVTPEKEEEFKANPEVDELMGLAGLPKIEEDVEDAELDREKQKVAKERSEKLLRELEGNEAPGPNREVAAITTAMQDALKPFDGAATRRAKPPKQLDAWQEQERNYRMIQSGAYETCKESVGILLKDNSRQIAKIRDAREEKGRLVGVSKKEIYDLLQRQIKEYEELDRELVESREKWKAELDVVLDYEAFQRQKKAWFQEGIDAWKEKTLGGGKKSKRQW